MVVGCKRGADRARCRHPRATSLLRFGPAAAARLRPCEPAAAVPRGAPGTGGRGAGVSRRQPFHAARRAPEGAAPGRVASLTA
ncbi:hypothetical protein ACFPM0_26330 [Pseudonocardia sulfidoxydans]|uniref:hypothetical protein n=1 Tax=Pseudonocardia sulfidoxydans TaxID=54011 RepID=UPI00361B4409